MCQSNAERYCESKHYSKLHADERIILFLTRNLSAVCYHSECYKAYTNERLLEQQKHYSDSMLDVVPPKSLRSFSDRFDWKRHCFLCAIAVILYTKHPTAKDSSVVCTLELCSTILEACGHRLDDYSLQVSGRLESCNDLVAVYHRHKFTNFMTRC